MGAHNINWVLIAYITKAVCIAIAAFAIARIGKAVERQISGFWQNTSRNNASISQMGSMPVIFLAGTESMAFFVLLSVFFALNVKIDQENALKAVEKLVCIASACLGLSMVGSSMAEQACQFFAGARREPQTLEKTTTLQILFFGSIEVIGLVILVIEALVVFR